MDLAERVTQAARSIVHFIRRSFQETMGFAYHPRRRRTAKHIKHFVASLPKVVEAYLRHYAFAWMARGVSRLPTLGNRILIRFFFARRQRC